MASFGILVRNARFAALAGSAALACGNPAGSPTTTLTVEVPAGGFLETGSVDYSFSCGDLENGAPTDESIRFEGNLERAGVGSDPERPTTVWRVASELPPGECLMQLRVRDPDGEVICSAVEAFAVSPDAPTEVYHFVICDFADFFFSLSSLELSVVTPKPSSPSGIHAVTYTVSCDARLAEDQAIRPVTVSGDLDERFLESLADFGAGPVVSSSWYTRIESLPPGTCQLELRALDEADGLVCRVDSSLEVRADRVDSIYVLLDCEG